MHSIKNALFVVFLFSMSAENAFSVSVNYQCKVSEHRIIEVFSLRGAGIPQVLDVRLDPSISNPFEDNRGFKECENGGNIDLDRARGITGRLIDLDAPSLEDRQDFVLERAGTRLRNRKTGITYECEPTPVYSSYCYCQHVKRSNPIEATCGENGDHFNRSRLLNRPVRTF